MVCGCDLGSALPRGDLGRPRRLLLNPNIAAARLVMSGSDLDRNVRQTAAQIAQQVTRRLKESQPAAR